VVVERHGGGERDGQGTAQVTWGYFRETHTRTHGNPYPCVRVWVLYGYGSGFCI